MAKLDITGERYGRLVAIEFAGRLARTSCWRCKCDCGELVVVALNNLRSGRTKSCGCFKRDWARENATLHGNYYARLFRIWREMKRRCHDPRRPAYSRYGGRGIEICSEWGEFSAFEDWALKNGYADNLTLDRIDNDGGYSPNNCRWASKQTQARNTSANVVVEFGGKTACLQEHADDAGLPYARVYARLKTGWSVEDALTVPKHARRRA